MTYKQWINADSHTFVPYQVYEFDRLSRFHLEYAHANEILATVSLSANPKLRQRPVVFAVGLTKSHGRWLVNYWMPKYTPPVLSNQ
jgi:hypothetical protein